MSKIVEKDFTGIQAGHLVGLFRSGLNTSDGCFPLWICKCHRCGRLALVSASMLNRNWKDTDCGCSKVDRLKKEIEEIRTEWSEDQKVIQAFYTGKGVKGVIRIEPKDDDLKEAIREAAKAGRPFTLTGQTGLWERWHKGLLPMFQAVSRDKLRTQARELLRHGVIVQCAAVGQKKAQWLDVPGGPFAIGRGKLASMAEKSA